MSGTSHASAPPVQTSNSNRSGLDDGLPHPIYDVNDPTTAIGGRPDPMTAHGAFGGMFDDGRTMAGAASCAVGSGSTCVGQQLHVSRMDIAFSQSRVGKRSTSSIVVTNTDPERTIELDGIDLVDDGMGNFEVHGANAILAPNQSYTVHVSYLPTGEGAHHASLRLFEKAGMTTPLVHLHGTASELDEERDERLAGLKADNKPRPTTFGAERKDAITEVLLWRNRVTDLLRATTTWTSLNWTKFLSETGGDFRVSWTEGHVSNVVGDYLSSVAGLLSTNPVIEFVASTFTSLIYDAIFTARGNRENEQAVYESVKKTGGEIEKHQINFARVERAAVARIEAQSTTAQHKVSTATEVAEIEHVYEWAKREAISVPAHVDTTDRSLYKRLLGSWVLERSATARESTDSTNRPAFDAARKTAFGLEKGQDIGRPDLFVFQARQEWTSLGISNVGELEERLMRQVQGLIHQARAASLDGPDVASFVSNMMSQPIVELKIGGISSTHQAMKAAGIPLPERDFLRHPLKCLVTLGPDGSSVIVKHFNYYLGRYVGTRAP